MSATAIQLRAALTGSFEEEERKALDRIERAVQAALFDYAGETQQKWRQDVASSGLRNAQRMTKTIRVRNYRNHGLRPASMVYSTFPILQRAFEQNTVVRSKNGLYLPVPNPAVWPSGRVPRPGGRGRANRSNTIAIAEQRFGPLRFVYRQGKASLLVAEVRSSNTRPGTFRRASATALRTGNGLTTIVVFFLVREVKLPRMLRGSVIRERAKRNAAAEVDRLFVRYFEQDVGPRAITGPIE